MAGAALAVKEVAPEPEREEREPGRAAPGLRVEAGGEARAGARTVADELEELGDQIARMAAHDHAFKRRYLALVAEFDRRRGWEPSGHRSCAHWLSFRTGHDLRTAREHVRVARGLEALPRIAKAMGRGRLSFSQARALTRVATPETEDELLALAEGCTVAHLERRVRAWRKGSRGDEAARERARHRDRRLAVFPDDDGTYLVTGRLTPEVGALLARALEAAEDALFRNEETGAEGADGSREPPSARQSRRQAARRRADAAGLLAERALAAGFGGEGAPVSGSRAERYQVLLLVEPDTLAEDTEPGRSELEDGTRVAAETARRLACDAAAVHVNRGPGGQVLDVGRRRRTVPPALRRALEVRDRGCRFPGCGLRFTDAHHIRHWADGGETNLDNCILLCRFHHRFVHEEGWAVEWWGRRGRGRAVFRDPRDRIHLEEPPETPEVPEEPAWALVDENLRRGVDPGPLDAGARWKRERDVPEELYLAALEAGFAAADGSAATADAPP